MENINKICLKQRCFTRDKVGAGTEMSRYSYVPALYDVNSIKIPENNKCSKNLTTKHKNNKHADALNFVK